MAANPAATPIVSAAPASVTVDVDTELRNAERFLREDGWPDRADAVALARAAVAELIAAVLVARPLLLGHTVMDCRGAREDCAICVKRRRLDDALARCAGAWA